MPLLAHYDLRIGDVLLTRNRADIGNASPGYWNHAAIVCPWISRAYCGLAVVEAQSGPGCVIAVNAADFLKRYYKIAQLRPRSRTASGRAVTAARQLVGTPYWRLASVWRWLRRVDRGENCVSLLRRSFERATRSRLNHWKRPDDLVRDDKALELLVIDVDRDWERPAQWFNGRLA